MLEGRSGNASVRPAMPDLLTFPFLISAGRCLHCGHGARICRVRCGDDDDTGVFRPLRAAGRYCAMPAARDRGGLAAAVCRGSSGGLAAARTASGRGRGLRAGRHPRLDAHRARADALGDLGHYPGGGRAAGERLALSRSSLGRHTSRLPPAPPAAFSMACRAWPVRRSPSTTLPARIPRRRCGPTSRPISSSSMLAAILVFASRGLIGWDTGVHGLVLAPAVMLGGLLGERLFPLASESFYRRLGARASGRRGDRFLDVVSGQA